MKSFVKLLGIIALVAAIGFTMIACDNGTTRRQQPTEPTDTAPTITTATLPNGTVGTPYSRTLAARGTNPKTWSIDTGSLPGGLTLSAAGVISGTPTAAGTSSFTVKATNAIGSGTKALSIVIDNSGMTWTAVADSAFNSDISAIAWGNDKFVAGGSSGKMAYSADGVTWTAVSDSVFGTSDITAIAWGSNKFVAVGENGKMAYSTDGITWTAVSDSTFDINEPIVNIAWGNNKFVAGGHGGIGFGGFEDLCAKIAYSADGINWISGNISMFGDGWAHAIVWGNNKFVAGSGNGKMAYSPDGITWTAVSDSTFDINGWIEDIAYGNGKFVAVGENGKMAYSTDGITWTAVTDSTFGNDSIYAIAWGNDKFVAGGDNGKMAYSADGVTWTDISGNYYTTIYAIAYGNNKFVAGGSGGGKMAYSSD